MRHGYAHERNGTGERRHAGGKNSGDQYQKNSERFYVDSETVRVALAEQCQVAAEKLPIDQ